MVHMCELMRRKVEFQSMTTIFFYAGRQRRTRLWKRICCKYLTCQKASPRMTKHLKRCRSCVSLKCFSYWNALSCHIFVRCIAAIFQMLQYFSLAVGELAFFTRLSFRNRTFKYCVQHYRWRRIQLLTELWEAFVKTIEEWPCI